VLYAFNDVMHRLSLSQRGFSMDAKTILGIALVIFIVVAGVWLFRRNRKK
jgi:hypothetical protein